MATPNDNDIIRPGSKVHVDFTVSDEEHATVQTDRSSFEVVVGFGQLLPQIEHTLLGMREGEKRTLVLAPHEAFGERDQAKVVEFDREEFPPDVVAGDHFEAEQENGAIVVLRVVEVLPDGVLIDLNHPLAGQSVFLTLAVTNVRPATQLELDSASSAAKRSAAEKLDALLPPERLLRGRNER